MSYYPAMTDTAWRITLADVVLGKIYRRAVERIGLDYIAAHIQECNVNVLHGVRPGDQQIFVAALKSQTSKILEREVLDLQISAHRAIKDDDAFFQCVEKISHL